jgi:2-methylisocitrate lyase-like PEP mutase family enzyme
LTDQTSARDAAKVLRVQLNEGWVFMAGCFDALSARLAEHAGFKTLHVTGFGVEASQLGAPDIGTITMPELAVHIARISAAVGIPALVDVDTGYGGIHNVMRTVREIERAGAGGLHIEDQAFPKRGPNLADRKIIPEDEAIGRVKAAIQARTDPDFVIVARSDASSFEEVVRRSNLYLEAGADVAMPLLMTVDGRSVRELPPVEQMRWYRRLVAEIDGPVLGRAIPPGCTINDMREAGFAMVILGTLSFHAAVTAMMAALREAIVDGTAQSYFEKNPVEFSSVQMMQLLGFDQYVEYEKRFGQG